MYNEENFNHSLKRKQSGAVISYKNVFDENLEDGEKFYSESKLEALLEDMISKTPSEKRWSCEICKSDMPECSCKTAIEKILEKVSTE